MGLVYLAALILGLGTIGLQFILSHVGGDLDADGDMDGGEIHLDGDVHLDGDMDLDGDLDVDHDVSAGDDAGSAIAGAASLFLSMRFWTFALMAFGMVGAALHYLDLSSFITALVLSIVTGLASGLAASFAFRALKKSAVSSSTSADEAVGRMARVTVPLRKGNLGKVRIEIKGKRIDLLAVSDSQELEAGQDVVVVEFRGDQALVEPISMAGSPGARRGSGGG